jgi:hypothetical protein
MEARRLRCSRVGDSASRAASNYIPETSRKRAIFMPQVRHADDGCPLRFLDFDAGELVWSIACPT